MIKKGQYLWELINITVFQKLDKKMSNLFVVSLLTFPNAKNGLR